MHPLLFVGCPMWANRQWVGRWLPADTPPGRELEPYSRLVNAVEGNTTFHAPPTPATVARWGQLADPGFRFVFKAPRTITHDRRLRDVDEELNGFLALIEPIAPLVGAITLQLPPSFAPVDLGVLAAVLRRVPRHPWRWAVELRHPAFFESPDRDEVDLVLARCGVERVLLDSRAVHARPPRTEEGRRTAAQKPRLPALTGAITDQPIVRFIGSDDDDLTATGLHEWEPIVADWLHDGRTPSVFIHTPDNLDTPGLARSFHEAMTLLTPDLTPLPEPWPVSPAEQGSLF